MEDTYDDNYFEQLMEFLLRDQPMEDTRSDVIRVRGHPLLLSDPIWKYDPISITQEEDLGQSSPGWEYDPISISITQEEDLGHSSPGWKYVDDFSQPIAKSYIDIIRDIINDDNDKCCTDGRTIEEREFLPRNQPVGGYIFLCSNDTMPENLEKMLFGLPWKYQDSVRAIRPGLPLFLYNYSTHLLHGIYEAASCGSINIDPSAWANCREKRYPSQVKATVRKIYEPLEDKDFRHFLYNFNGCKFRLQLSIPETLALLHTFEAKRGSGYYKIFPAPN